MYCSEAANFLVPVMLISAIAKLQRVAAASGSIGGGSEMGLSVGALQNALAGSLMQ